MVNILQELCHSRHHEYLFHRRHSESFSAHFSKSTSLTVSVGTIAHSPTASYRLRAPCVIQMPLVIRWLFCSGSSPRSPTRKHYLRRSLASSTSSPPRPACLPWCWLPSGQADRWIASPSPSSSLCFSGENRILAPTQTYKVI